MIRNELAKIIAEVILDDFNAIKELYDANDTQGLIDEIYEALENMD